ncbi:Eukaryotic translation initiation factor 3 subunit D [Hibiscus syriacus]|uniref:Eukaryotic translation initiation factor 3 subunit D n=1 Tax=Hibiscus syriacus TaxID=106335 RepID=A0A6A2Z5P1_HIBSY|nr:Eukaryotic translation initiation factor 3 subunit D [Hibiscus syriacus]
MVGVFEVGAVPFNNDVWGPPDFSTTPAAAAATLPLQVPFAPLSRSEKLGRIADFTRYFANGNPSNRPSSWKQGSASESHFNFSLDLDAFPLANPDDDSSFRLVDAKPPTRPKFGPKWRFNQNQPQLPQLRDEEVEARKREAEKERARRDWLYNLNRLNQNQQRREAAFFKSSNERRLGRFKNRNFFKVTTTDDPVIRRLANEDKATVFATDTILATLMCAPRSVYSWDIVIQRVGNKLFFDKRDVSQLDLLSVHETSQEPLPEAKDDINSAYSLSVEAAYVNQNFSQHVLLSDGNKVSFDEPNPFSNEGDEVASVAYRYRRWKLDNDIHLVARCEVQSVVEVNNQKSFLILNALNEFDSKYSGVDWRQKLETQRGAVLATELKNNANKLAKWTAQSIFRYFVTYIPMKYVV